MFVLIDSFLDFPIIFIRIDYNTMLLSNILHSNELKLL